MSKPLAGLVLLVVLAVAVVLGWSTLSTPEPVDMATAGAGGFATERALAHVRAIAAEPHAMGTPAHDRVRDYLVAELEELGLAPEVQTAVGRRGVRAGTVDNVLARIEGSGGGERAILLMAHYDSTPFTYGAADDASGVATLLETARALTEGGEPPVHDVVLLFTDGEETGLLGAEAFERAHPWSEDVALVLNFEARGNQGPGLMFETGADNAWLIDHLADTDRPVAGSYSYEIYRRMPNDTDYTVFRQAGVPGLNFAFIGGAPAYHTALDTTEALAPDSLQHMGTYALGLVRSLDGADLAAEPPAGDAIYFNLVGSSFVHFPASVGLVLLILAFVGLVIALVRGFRSGVLDGVGLVMAFCAQFLVTVIVTALIGGLSMVAFEGPRDFTVWGDGSSISLVVGALALVAGGVALATHLLTRSLVNPPHLAAGGAILWTVVAVLVSLVAPGASYLFTLPLLFQVAVLWQVLGTPAADSRRVPVPLWVAAALALLVAGTLWTPFFSLVAAGLQTVAGVLVAAFLLLLLALLSPQVEMVGSVRPSWLVPVALVALGVVVLVAVRAAGDWDEVNPRPNTLFYALDADEDAAVWASFDAPDEWTGEVLGESPTEGPLDQFLGFPRPMFYTAAPVVEDLAGPELDLLSVEPAGEGREGIVYRFRVRSAIDGHRMRVHLEADAPFVAVRAEGEAMVEPGPAAAEGDQRYRLLYHAPPADGLDLEVELAAVEDLDVAVVDQVFELPETVSERPSDLIPGYLTWDTDSSLVLRRFDLEPDSVVAAPTEPTSEAAAEVGAAAELR